MIAWLGIILIIALFVGAFAAVVWLTHRIVGVMDQATTHSDRPTQFLLTDLIWLLVQLQITLAVLLRLVPRDDLITFIIILTTLWSLVFMIWWAAVGTMSRAVVRGGGRRTVFIMLVMPAAVLGPTMLVLFNCFMLTTLLDNALGIIYWLLLLGTVNPIALLALHGCRRLTFWILAGRKADDEDLETST